MQSELQFLSLKAVPSAQARSYKPELSTSHWWQELTTVQCTKERKWNWVLLCYPGFACTALLQKEAKRALKCNNYSQLERKPLSYCECCVKVVSVTTAEWIQSAVWGTLFGRCSKHIIRKLFSEKLTHADSHYTTASRSYWMRGILWGPICDSDVRFIKKSFFRMNQVNRLKRSWIKFLCSIFSTFVPILEA